MFRAMFSPIIRSIWLYLQYLLVFTQVAAGWCLGWVETAFQLIQDTSRQLHIQGQFIIPSQLYMFRAMFSPIIRSIWLSLQYLVVFTQVAAVWCLGWVETVFQLIQDTSRQLHI